MQGMSEGSINRRLKITNAAVCPRSEQNSCCLPIARKDPHVHYVIEAFS